MAQQSASRLRYEGCNFFRQRIVLATLSCRPVSITNIRTKNDDPGLRGMYLILKLPSFGNNHNLNRI